jgi:hypothetical protein
MTRDEFSDDTDIRNNVTDNLTDAQASLESAISWVN